MSLRQKFRVYRSTVWRGTPVGDFTLGVTPVPARPFVVVTAAYPRRRDRAAAAGRTIALHDAVSEDELANEKMSNVIRDAGFAPLACVGADPASPHREPSWWVWDATPAQAVEWGRAFDQYAILAGDGSRASLVPCHPEWEPGIAPDVVLILHEPDGDGEGTPALLERELRGRGWTQTIFLRPTLPIGSLRGVSPTDLLVRGRESVAAELAHAGAAPMLVIGLRESGLLAVGQDAPWRIGVSTPWSLLSPDAIAREATWPGWMAIHGEGDVEARKDLAALPREVPRLVDPEGTPDLAPWIGRIADGVFRLWTAPLAPRAAIAAGWKVTGYRGTLMRGAAADAAAGHAVAAGIAIVGGVVLAVVGVALGLVGLAFFAVLAVFASGSPRALRTDVLFMIGALLLGLGGGAGLVFAGFKLARSLRPPSSPPTRP